MAELDQQRQCLTVKLVYYGAALAGKTTNLTRLHELLAPELKGDMMTRENDGDRTLFFDLLPLGVTAPSGMLIKFKVFTVPGQVAHEGTRKALLAHADAVVFVADSQRHQTHNNAAAFENLMGNLAILDTDVAQLPMVVQFNKRDLPDIVSERELKARWSSAPWPLLFASAHDGAGVLATFATLLSVLYDSLDRGYALASDHSMSRAAFLAAIGVR